MILLYSFRIEFPFFFCLYLKMAREDVIGATELKNAVAVIAERFRTACIEYEHQLSVAQSASLENRSAVVHYPPPPRIIVGLAGRPGSGKTTVLEVIAAKLEECLMKRYQMFQEHASDSTKQRGLPPFPPKCVCMPMDGYHLYRKELSAMPNPKHAFERRGAEWTFNPEKLAKDLRALRTPDPATANTSGVTYAEVRVPSFDHGVGDPKEEGIVIPPTAAVVLVEGNYLLFTGKPSWKAVADLFDVKLFLACPRDVCTERLCKRHMKAWNISREKGMIRAKGSDTKNGDLVDTTKCNADLVIHSIEVSKL